MHTLDIGDEVVANGRTGQVMDLFTHGQAMVQWDDELFCRLVRTEDLSPAHSYRALFTQPKQRRSLLGWTVFSLIAGLLVAGVLVMAAPAKANLVTRSVPYGGCKEVVQDPATMGRTEGGAWCRAHGWTIRPRLVVGDRGVVRFHRMPSCEHEDASSDRPCSWNIRGGDGNGRGLAFWADERNHAHYVWPSNPAHKDGWRWVSRPLGDALSEGEDGTSRDWGRCVVRRGPTTVIRCADGWRWTS